MVTNNSANEKTAASGKVLQGQGIGVASDFSTATYPATATGTGTILRADGTNWSATTATYPNTAGTSGNVLTSDGTNWNSSAPASGTAGYAISLNGMLSGCNPADGTTYFLSSGFCFTASTSASSSFRYFLPVAGTITKCYGSMAYSNSPSNENCTFILRLNNTTDITVTSALSLSASSPTAFSNSGLSQAVSAGDFIHFKFTGPTWSTNPTSCVICCTIFVAT